MHAISETDVKIRIKRDNPWWDAKDVIPEAKNPKRVYFQPFCTIALNFDIKRAAILLGPRRVGKTFMIKQLIAHAIAEGINPKNILYVSIDSPVYSGISLEQFISFIPSKNKERYLVIFDEIQYLRNWEVHLKDLVDNYKNIKFIATGSAAASLKLKSQESGAGRFSDFMLPPLTFYEFLLFIGEEEKYISRKKDKEVDSGHFTIHDINGLNTRFIDYLNYGGYPEAVLNDQIRLNPDQFIRNDIIDKVLLKDLPNLYGINGIQELNKLFSFLAYNAGNEASFEKISKESGIAKATVKKYIDYLESAFLIIKVSTVDDNCRTMQRERNFKVYLNNPSMQAALFAPVTIEDTDKLGRLTESAIFSQWQHSTGARNLRYARWRNEGEVDIVYLGPAQKPLWISEIKWSDRVEKNWEEETKSLAWLLKRHKSIAYASLTSKTLERSTTLENRPLKIYPSSAQCYIIGRNVTSSLTSLNLEHLITKSMGVKIGVNSEEGD